MITLNKVLYRNSCNHVLNYAKGILLAPKVLDQFYIEEVEVVRAEGIKMHPNCGSVGKSVSILLIAVSCSLWIQVSIIILFKFSLHCVSA